MAPPFTLPGAEIFFHAAPRRGPEQGVGTARGAAGCVGGAGRLLPRSARGEVDAAVGLAGQAERQDGG